MRILSIIIIVLTTFPYLFGQIKVDSLGFETFESVEGDTTYVMKKYYLILLNEGENRDQDEVEAAKIQAGHMAHINMLADNNQLCIAGPSAVEGKTKGIFILNVPTEALARELVNKDPAVKAGRLECTILPFWAAKGSKLF